MRHKNIILFFSLVFLFIGEAAFADTAVKAELDKTSITTDDALTYKLTITSSVNKMPQPKLPAFEGFVALSQAQTSEISISGGTQKISVLYVFILAPINAGRLKIGPAQIQIEGKDYLSDAFTVEVTQGKAKISQPKIQQKPSLPKEPPPETKPELPKITL